VTLGSTRTRIAVACALAAAALAALATGVLGGPADTGPGPHPAKGGPAGESVLTAQRVREPSGPAKGAPNPRVFYLETTRPVDDIVPGPGGYVLKKCPKGSRAINGYYFQTDSEGYGVFEGFGLDDQGSSPFGFHKWGFYFDNVATDQGVPAEIDGVTFGIVCDKDG
jgi:hypothetical protein